MDKNISLKSVISNINEQKDYKTEIKIEKYIPIMDKDIICRKFLLKKNMFDFEIMDAVTAAIELEMLWKFNVLLEYTNIVVEDEDITFSNYDILDSNGFFIYIEHECYSDYIRLKSLVDSVLGISDTMVVSQILKQAGGQEFVKAANDLKQILGSENTLKEINKILDYNNPFVRKKIEELRQIDAK